MAKLKLKKLNIKHLQSLGSDNLSDTAYLFQAMVATDEPAMEKTNLAVCIPYALYCTLLDHVTALEDAATSMTVKFPRIQ